MHLVIGAGGLIGQALLRELRRRGLPAQGTDQRPGGSDLLLDLGAPERFTPPAGTGVAFLCAGTGGVEACATSPEATARINVTGTLHVAGRLAKAGYRLVYLSSSYVLDGSGLPGSSAAVSPCCEYGRQKARVEAALPPTAAVVRLTRVAESLRPRLQAWSRALRAGETVEASPSLRLAPVALDPVIAALAGLATTFARGRFHLSAPDDLTYAEVAARLARRLGADPALVQPRDSAGLHWFAPLPRTAVLTPAAPDGRTGWQLPAASHALLPVLATVAENPE